MRQTTTTATKTIARINIKASTRATKVHSFITGTLEEMGQVIFMQIKLSRLFESQNVKAATKTPIT